MKTQILMALLFIVCIGIVLFVASGESKTVHDSNHDVRHEIVHAFRSVR